METSSHRRTRSFLRIAGPLLVATGLVFIGVGMASFFSAFGTFQPPRLFWCVFVGMPIVMVGLAMCKFGYMGAVTRYMATETAPVAKDAVNYLVDETSGAVRKVARSVAEGVREAGETKQRDEADEA